METNEFSKKWIFKILKQSSGDEEKSGCSRAFAMQGCRPELSYQQLLNNPSVLCAPVSPALTKMETEVLWVLLSAGLAERPMNSKIQERSCLKGGFSKDQGKSDRDGHAMTLLVHISAQADLQTRTHCTQTQTRTPKTPPTFLENRCPAELCFMTTFSTCQINSPILLKEYKGEKHSLGTNSTLNFS